MKSALLILTPCVLLGSSFAFAWYGFEQHNIYWTIFGLALAICTSFTAGLSFANRVPRILKEHDPNKPFTAEELRQIGIVPPERYDCEHFVR